MDTLFATGRIVDLIVAATLLEAIAVLLWLRRRRGVAHHADLFANLAAGLFLLAALRAALTDAAWQWIALSLLAALAAHLAALRLRLKVSG